MRSIRILAFAALSACAVVPVVGSAQDSSAAKIALGAATQSGDLVATLQQAGNYNTFLTLLKQANLSTTLQGSVRFTVFAPTDEAFSHVAKSTLDEIASDSVKLRKVLTYHIVNGVLPANKILKLKDARTLQGSRVSFFFKNGRMHVNDAVIIQPDIKATNGVIHGLDAVLMPEL